MEFNRLMQIRRIYAQRAALELPRGKEIVERWPDADVVLVENHWNIPELHGDETNVPRWSRIKTEALVLGVKKALTVKPTPDPRTSLRHQPPTAAPWHAPTATCPGTRGTATR